MEYTCKICGKKFKRYDYKRKNLYCSRECATIGRTIRKKVELNCDYCGKKITKYEGAIKKNNFCSIECANKFQGRNKVKLVCRTCGKEFYRSPSWLSQRKGYYCSLKCRTESEEWRTNSVIRSNQVQNKKRGPNKLEKLGCNMLDYLGIKYETEYLIDNKICVDVYIEDYNLIIQWDGNYWHGKDKLYEELDTRQKKRVDLDKSQDAYFKKCGFNELRFWEDDVYEREEFVVDNIKKTVDEITRRVS